MTQKRIAVTFSRDTSEFLAYIAQQKRKSVAKVVQELTMKGLDWDENEYLCKQINEMYPDGWDDEESIPLEEVEKELGLAD